MGTGVRGAASFYLARADPEQMAFVFEHAPQLPAHGGSVGPVAESPAHASTTSFGFERGQVFSADQPTVVEQREQDQQIGGQMGEFAVAPFIFLPTGLDACFVEAQLFLPVSKMERQRRLVCFIGFDRLRNKRAIALFARFEAINLAAQTCLPPIQASGIEKDWAADLTIRLRRFPSVRGRNRDHRADTPIPSY